MTRPEILAAVSRIVMPAGFAVPQYLVQSSWLDHGPFAFVLTQILRPRTFVELGAHNGYSYFAFCEAAKALGLGTKCYAVDTWKGDEHSGLYTEQVYQSVDRHNEANYAAFSRLVRATFDQAVAHFTDGSIDLLHIDGRHFYDDVKHDFETWRPKLSDRAVVIFHDVNVRERDFGVFKFWDELSAQHPSFAFHHGHGLGVLGYGASLAPEVAAFFATVKDDEVADEIRRVFSRLGGGIKAQQMTREQSATLHERDTEITKLKARIENVLEIQVEEFRADILTERARSHELGIQLKAQAVLKADQLEAQAALNADQLQAQAVQLQAQSDQHAVVVSQLEAKAREIANRADVAADVAHHAELKAAAQAEVVQSLQRSLSWRVTAPLRSFRRFETQARRMLRARTKSVARAIYHAVPIPLATKRRIINPIFGAIGRAPRPVKETARAIEIDFSAAVPFGYETVLPPTPRLAAICHIFHENMTSELQRYLRNIPFAFDVFVSTDTPAKRRVIESYFSGWTEGAVQVRVTANRGRDIAPKLLAFRDVYEHYEYFVHLHTKASSTANHPEVFGTWRGFIFENLLGSPEIVRSVFDAFLCRPDLGMVAAQHFEAVRPHLNWGDDFPIAQNLAKRMGLDIAEDRVFDFPSGSMFWARSAALKPLLKLDLQLADFAAEAGQMDGTLAHAIERSYFFACEAAGHRWIKIAHPPVFADTTSIAPIESPEVLDRFVTEHSLVLTAPTVPPARHEAPPHVGTPVPALVTRLQESALGIAQTINPATNVVIGVVTYNNSADQLQRVIASAASGLELAGLSSKGNVLILDNGDSSAAVTVGNPAVTVLPTAGNVGFGAGHNRMMREAFAGGADIYIATNPDGAFEPEAVRALVQMMQAQGGRALIEALQFPDEHPKPYDPITFETPWVSGACLAIPRAALEELGGFDESFFMYCEDVDLSWRARANGFILRTCPRALFLHAVTNRAPNPAVLRMIFGSGVVLGRKWANPKFVARLTDDLAKLGAVPPGTYPAPVPAEWLGIADFDHYTSFALPRW